MKMKRPRTKHYKLRDLEPEIRELQEIGSMSLRDHNQNMHEISKQLTNNKKENHMSATKLYSEEQMIDLAYKMCEFQLEDIKYHIKRENIYDHLPTPTLTLPDQADAEKIFDELEGAQFNEETSEYEIKISRSDFIQAMQTYLASHMVKEREIKYDKDGICTLESGKYQFIGEKIFKIKEGETAFRKFNLFLNHGDESGRGCWTICYGEIDDVDNIVVAVEDDEKTANESCKRLNSILKSVHMVAPKEIALPNIKCKCSENEKHGETSIMCCNHCGLPTEAFWTNTIQHNKGE